MKSTKRIFILLLGCVLCLSLCACGGSGRYKAVKTLQELDYYIGFRSGDQVAFYVDSAIKVLESEGAVAQLSTKWFGTDSVSFDSDAKAIENAGYIAPRTLIVGVDENAYPISCKDGEVYSGFNVELAQSICDKLGWQVQFISIQPQNAYVELSSGNVDMAMGATGLDPASKDYTAYGPYIKSQTVLVALSSSGSRTSGKTLVMDTSDFAMSALDANPAVKEKLGKITRAAGSTSSLFEKLSAGECDLILTDKISMEYYNTH